MSGRRTWVTGAPTPLFFYPPSIPHTMNLRPFTNLHWHALAGVMMTTILFAAASSACAEITGEELNRFVRGYLNAAQQPTPDAEVDHYANRVRYFDSGTVDRDFVAADQRRYYKQWPERSFELLDGPVITDHDGDAATVKFTIRYEVRGESRRATGLTENTMRVQRFGDDLRIVAMSERKVNARDLPRQPENPRMENRTAETRRSAPPTKRSTAKELPPPVAPERQTPKRETAVEQTQGPRRNPDRVPAQPDSALQKATPVPEAPGFVFPPGTEHTPKNMIDVRGYAAGQKVKDPRTGQIFIVP